MIVSHAQSRWGAQATHRFEQSGPAEKELDGLGLSPTVHPRSLLDKLDESSEGWARAGLPEPLHRLLDSGVIVADHWESLPAEAREQITSCDDFDALVALLTENGLVTLYQAKQIRSGRNSGLILNNYRILDQLGAGGMGVVYKAEHMLLQRTVAIKAVSWGGDASARLLQRFYAEMRTIAGLNHTNIVAALDAGEIPSSGPHTPALHYLVMEYVDGDDLEKSVCANGPLSVSRACSIIYQVAGALAEAHQYHLVHRDIKPSNILVTSKGVAKLLDFGLARQFRHRVTEPGIMMGTIDFLAPEQAQDASAVDIRADIYGLGGTLYWCLAGQTPFPQEGTIAENLLRRMTKNPPSVLSRRPDLPPELDAVVTRMMACNPDERFPTPHAVMNALLPFLGTNSQDHGITLSLHNGLRKQLAHREVPKACGKTSRVLVVDDEMEIRRLCRAALESEGIYCDEAADGSQALEILASKEYDLVLLDVKMPGVSGRDVVLRLRANPPAPNLKIIMFSGHLASDDLAQVMASGVDDFVTKPFSVVQLMARIKSALHLKEAQDRAGLLNNHLLAANCQLEQNLEARGRDLIDAHKALVLALAKLVEHRDTEKGSHIKRVQAYCRCLADEAAKLPAFRGQIDEEFVRMLEWSVPLHDIGKAGIPDRILQKEGMLDPEECIILKTHTILGAETLEEVARQHGSAMTFLQMAIDVARHHHERYDGTGYPDRLAGNDIPLAARLLSIADVYDALRSRRIYKPALPHRAAMQMMLEASPGQFDPALLQAFLRCADDFARIFLEFAD